MPIPDLTGTSHEYWLPPGEHPCTLEEVENMFVYNEQRQNVWRAFLVMLQRLKDLGGTLDEVLVNGSFVTGRTHPDDVDAVCLFPPEDARPLLARAVNQQVRALQIIISDSDLARELFGVHFFFAASSQYYEDMRISFTRGPAGTGLRHPDLQRDPPDLVVPEEKGILKVHLTDFFQ